MSHSFGASPVVMKDPRAGERDTRAGDRRVAAARDFASDDAELRFGDPFAISEALGAGIPVLLGLLGIGSRPTLPCSIGMALRWSGLGRVPGLGAGGYSAGPSSFETTLARVFASESRGRMAAAWR